MVRTTKKYMLPRAVGKVFFILCCARRSLDGEDGEEIYYAGDGRHTCSRISNSAREGEGHSGITTFQSVVCMTKDEALSTARCTRAHLWFTGLGQWAWRGGVRDRVQQLGGQEATYGKCS